MLPPLFDTSHPGERWVTHDTDYRLERKRLIEVSILDRIKHSQDSCLQNATATPNFEEVVYDCIPMQIHPLVKITRQSRPFG